MVLAKLNNIKKYYGDRLVLDIKNFEILDGDRIGIVGENGAGKTTLLKILVKNIEPDEGQIFLTQSYEYISQLDNYMGECEDNKLNKMLNTPTKYEEFLSGGEKIKLKISKALSENKKLLIADEPTSNLDEKSIKILEDMLKNFKGSLLIVSHDRDFLDSLCNYIVEIDNGKLKVFKGNYSKYVKLKKQERIRNEFEYEEYINEKKRIEKSILGKEELRESIKRTPKRMGNSEARLHKMGGQKAKKNIDNNIKSLKSRILHLEVKEKPKDIREIKINIQDGKEIISKNIIEVKNLNLFAGSKLLLKGAKFKVKKGRKAAIIGDNGCGKTSLLKEIFINEKESIKVANGVTIGYFDQNQSILIKEKSILENVSEGCAFDQGFIRINLDNFGFKGDDVYKLVSSLSGGEIVKAALCKILLSNNNLLILDEPTNYLDIKAMEALERALINTEKTIILVSHDRKFVENVCDYIIEIENESIKEFDGKYKEYIIEKNKPIITTIEKENKEKLMLLKNKLSEIISLLSIEKDSHKKQELEKEYAELLKNIKTLEP
ncbi:MULTISPECIES: ABC-F type ribosomal protection protein CplR [unclassified Clostridium]|uniref:ABC-F type ribosomal protection protein CplR n=1 Tax=unclassified Clostridium TaxID=2614128 RepID=UPI0002973604|nr:MULTISPECIES: ABC-F type ribosomal protection protein CplR [unclassified Clostridium]EKQ58265.1 MAG: ATPase component of ABC transporter [Clostridium sp. Maddingley MBC34-26]